jgi:hypothetical protein
MTTFNTMKLYEIWFENHMKNTNKKNYSNLGRVVFFFLFSLIYQSSISFFNFKVHQVHHLQLIMLIT